MARRFRNILCPVDPGEGWGEALDYACDLAEEDDATLYLLSVLPADPGIGAPAGGSPEEEEPLRAKKEMRSRVEELVRGRLRSGVHYEILTGVGDPAETIVQFEEVLAADLVVLSTHGRRGVARLALGSVAEQVVRQSRCPVLTIRR